MAKQYEILKSLPGTGPMYIPVSGGNNFYSDFTEGYAVRFYKTDGTDWVANIKSGHTSLYRIFELGQSSNLLVIAGGFCYLIDPENIEPIAAFGGSYQLVVQNNKGQFVISDDTELTIIEPNGEYWYTERISLDGIKELKMEGDCVTGLAYMPTSYDCEWLSFSVNITTKKITGGWFQSKPWWKFWQTND